MVSVWNGREAHALREALRMSIDDFAAHLGASRRGVARWSAAPAVRLRWDMQRALDRALAQAPPAARQRMHELLLVSAPSMSREKVDGARILAGMLVPAPVATGGAKPALFRLEKAVAQARIGYQACRYRQTTDELPALMQTLAEARADGTARFPERIQRLAAAAHEVTASLLLKLGDVPLAMLAAQRAAHEAEASGDPLAIKASARIMAKVLRHAGHPDRALALILSATNDKGEGPRALSVHGSLLLCGALIDERLLEEAETIDIEGNFAWTGFGPANVALHRMLIHLAHGDAKAALETQVDPARLAYPERRATYYLTAAEAHRHLKNAGAALSALDKARRIAPEEVGDRSSANF